MPKTVQLSDEAYATLAALKRQGESFSDVVRRLASERKDSRALLKLSPPRDDVDFDSLSRRSAAIDRRRLRDRLRK